MENYCRQEKWSGSLTTQELKKVEDVWLEVAQNDGNMGSHMELNVDKVVLWGCSGRDPDYHPVFIPSKHLLTTSIIERCHEETLAVHGGIQCTMGKVPER